MEDILGKVVSSIVAIIAFVFLPVILITLKTEDAVQSYVQSRTVSFIDDCRASGCISPQNYLTYVYAIGATGTYDIQIEHQSSVAYPGQDPDTWLNGSIAYYRDEILNEMFGAGSEQDYPMKNGDYLSITVQGKGSGITDALLMFFTGTDGGKVAVSYGGQVGGTA